MAFCLSCGTGIDEYDSGYYARNMLCIPCYNQKISEVPMASCSRCGMRVKRSEARERHSDYHCAYCFSEEERQAAIPKCPICDKQVESWQESAKSSKGSLAHLSCLRDGLHSAGHGSGAGVPSQETRPHQRALIRNIIGRIGAFLA